VHCFFTLSFTKLLAPTILSYSCHIHGHTALFFVLTRESLYCYTLKVYVLRFVSHSIKKENKKLQK